MKARCFDGIVDAEPSCACGTDSVALYAWLRDQKFKGGVEISLVKLLAVFLFSSAFAVPAFVDRERVDAGRCKSAIA